MAKYALGLDYGTNSVRALVVDVTTGQEVRSAVVPYLSGEQGILLDPRDPNLARQRPSDYISGFVEATRQVLDGFPRESVVGIGVDTTGSSPMPLDADGNALASHPEWQNHLAAQCWLWKDHTAYAEAAEITAKAKDMGLPYLHKCGQTYSSEWFWSKILRCARVAPEVFEAAASWAEIADWIPAILTGNQHPSRMKRSICAAGHKAMFSDEWGGLPSQEFLQALDPRLADLRSRLYDQAATSDQVAGLLTEEFAQATGLRPGTPVAVGAFDAHFGAVASGVKEGVLVKIMGTSTCDCMVHPQTQPLADIPGVCGVVRGSILPGFYGIEAGQSAVGDIFNWVSRLTGRPHETLTAEAESLRPGESGLLALDWNNGNRTILVDPLLSGLLLGQTLHTTPGEVYRAAIESTAFGALMIIQRIEEYGVKVDEVVCCGGIAEKSALTMQIYADVLNRPMKVASSPQTCALGSAIFGAVVGGAFPDVESAQAVLASTCEKVFMPCAASVAIYAQLFRLYQRLHDGFGLSNPAQMASVMKDLIAIREAARG